MTILPVSFATLIASLCGTIVVSLLLGKCAIFEFRTFLPVALTAARRTAYTAFVGAPSQ